MVNNDPGDSRRFKSEGIAPGRLHGGPQILEVGWS